MHVRFLTALSEPGATFYVDEVHDLPEARALALIAGGICERAEPEVAMRAPARETAARTARPAGRR